MTSPTKRLIRAGGGNNNIRWIILAFAVTSLSFIGFFTMTLHNTENGEISQNHIRGVKNIPVPPVADTLPVGVDASPQQDLVPQDIDNSTGVEFPAEIKASMDSKLEDSHPSEVIIPNMTVPHVDVSESHVVIDTSRVSNISDQNNDSLVATVESTLPYKYALQFSSISVGREEHGSHPFKALRTVHAQFIRFFNPKIDAMSYSVYHTENSNIPYQPSINGTDFEILTRFHSALKTGQVSKGYSELHAYLTILSANLEVNSIISSCL